MYYSVCSESIISAIASAVERNVEDDITQKLIINIGCEILDVSQDKMIEMIDKNIEEYK